MAKMIFGGDRVLGADSIEVVSPFDGSVIDVVPRGTPADALRALEIASKSAPKIGGTPAFDRSEWLKKAAHLLHDRADTFARTICGEEGKTLAEAAFEVSRAVQTIELSGEEAKRIAGEGVPLDGAPGGGNKLGFTIRVPCGVVVAITPFNFPLNLVAHKVGPAIAAGNAVVLKPASNTPLSALLFVELLLEAGVPEGALQCVTGPGGELSAALCSDRRVRKISFTGSQEVGERICRTAGVKRVTMELGSNAPLIVMDDADLEKVAAAIVATGYSNAGQVCISTQRVLTQKSIQGPLLDLLIPKVQAMRIGDPLAPETQMGPMIRREEAERVENWIREAVEAGARLETGGTREGAMLRPAVVTNVHKEMRICKEELFGPAVAVQSFDDIEEAIALANDGRYGLAAGIFTKDLGRAMRFIREVDSGNLHVNWGPQWRADLMPYGGLKDSGVGKEGPAHAVREMTEEKMVIFHL